MSKHDDEIETMLENMTEEDKQDLAEEMGVQLDELSKDTLKSYPRQSAKEYKYHDKAGDEASSKSDEARRPNGAPTDKSDRLEDKSDRHYDIANKRGLRLANKKLKESKDLSISHLLDESLNLSEDFKVQMDTIFEAAVVEQTQLVEQHYEDLFEEALEEATEEMFEDVAVYFDKYLSYVAEQFITENEVEIETSIRNEINESLVNDILTVLESHNINITDEEADIVSQAQLQMEQICEDANDMQDEILELRNTIAQYQMEGIVSDLSEGLSQTQAEKFETLLEDISITSVGSFASKAKTIRESFFNGNEDELNESVGKGKKQTQQLNETAKPSSYAAALRKSREDSVF